MMNEEITNNDISKIIAFKDQYFKNIENDIDHFVDSLDNITIQDFYKGLLCYVFNDRFLNECLKKSLYANRIDIFCLLTSVQVCTSDYKIPQHFDFTNYKLFANLTFRSLNLIYFFLR